METSYYTELLTAVVRELIEWRNWVVGVFLVVVFTVLGVGFFWPERYETSAMLYADVTNIIQPLLKGRAELTAIDRSEQAREQIYTRKIMLKVANEIGMIDSFTTVEEQEGKIASLRKNIGIKNEGKNYFRVNYSNHNQDTSFNVLNAVVDSFIKETSEKRRKESRSAYEFIEQQVVSYKRQLLLAETQLKEFKSKNLDGDQRSVSARINQLRLQIEELKLTIGETDARDKSLREQMKNESEYLSAKSKVDEEKARLAMLKEALDKLRLSYQETYPDIVTLKQQISAQQLVIDAMKGSDYRSGSSSSESIENPLYEELRKQQAEAEVDLRSQKNRLASVERMLGEEYQRAERIASKDAELAELVRDYDVTRDIYEEMLGRKEKARLSMALDVEGQGVSFKIQEPAVYPLYPSGTRFIHFALVAPIAGLLAGIGLVILYVIVDPRLRSPSKLADSLPDNIELLAVVPHIRTKLSARLVRVDMLVLSLVCLIAMCIYGGLVWGRLSGYL
ncbi:XrtA system polysaccharide chain length determinant [Oceanicoccus sagamiensis]|uniref:Chain length-determining protein n=1 Tax=Oceanicoccus sagamiensis TaxID=716816 RepID=A0A1X9NHX3_9GAMM|nr:XrtA system polysaccharide chain length determinant [Oceanicoccus sagamiensis]ARN74507.1 chain length-determining protein [Oceanicoccus sagamiensis]